ncbi:MarR family winged helix-turn-helix transcriptional regulator [Actinosynnema sp. ALI-1.44]|uniref:MarR family winged helix-turn-helix transcriptional regulator n=1 Tax=Actinosynnema sp. ALI-1.44 TaxID=1933779 RepID=UPI001EDB6D76|nr:MarR family transcriptional regulator [Actinosynnema sp. ALI-1.44]
MAVIGRVTRLARVLDSEMRRTFAKHDLDRPAFDVLATLRRSGRLTPVELMRSAMITSGAISQRLDRLEARGLVTRQPDSTNGRRVYVDLTAEGRELIDRALPDHVDTEHRLLKSMTRAQRDKLAGTLRNLLLALDDFAEEDSEPAAGPTGPTPPRLT